MLAPLSGWICGCGLIAAAVASIATAQWVAAALFFYAGGGLCAWADWLQATPSTQ